jgi:hypothetical protein
MMYHARTDSRDNVRRGGEVLNEPGKLGAILVVRHEERLAHRAIEVDARQPARGSLSVRRCYGHRLAAKLQPVRLDHSHVQ